MDEKPIMYRDMSERDLLKWTLDYTKPWVIGTFESIPDDRLAVRPRPNINAPGWIFGHIVVTERTHVGRFLEGVDDVPEPWRTVFRAPKPTEAEIRQAIASKADLIDYWHGVRAKTHAYLDRVTDADLKGVPQNTLLTDDDPNRHNPIREWFVMPIQHQNGHWGQLQIIAKLIAADA